MKSVRILMIAAAVALSSAVGANAQYYQLATQAADMIRTAATGGMNYRGYVDAAFAGGVGKKRTDVFELSTTQGIKVTPQFFIGVGAGLQLLLTDVNNDEGEVYYPWMANHDYTTTGVAIPLFTDLRLDLGNQSDLSFFADLKLGASFMTGSKLIRIGDGYVYSSQCFYLRPTLGMRIPLTKNNNKMAMTVGLTYQLLTSGSWYMNHNSVTLNAIGANVGFEW